MIIKYIILFTLAAILLSLGYGMYYILTDKGQSTRAAKALTIRIVLSVTLFVSLAIGFATGVIKPHGVYPTQGQTQAP